MQHSITPVKTIQIRPTVIGCVLLIISVFYFLLGPDTSLSLINVLVAPGYYGTGESSIAFTLNFICTMAGLVMLYKGGISVAIAAWISNKQPVFMAFKNRAKSTQKIRKSIVISLFVLASLVVLFGLRSWLEDGSPPFQSARFFSCLVRLRLLA